MRSVGTTARARQASSVYTERRCPQKSKSKHKKHKKHKRSGSDDSDDGGGGAGDLVKQAKKFLKSQLAAQQQQQQAGRPSAGGGAAAAVPGAGVERRLAPTLQESLRITADDYFAKSTEFTAWLQQEKRLFFNGETCHVGQAVCAQLPAPVHHVVGVAECAPACPWRRRADERADARAVPGLCRRLERRQARARDVRGHGRGAQQVCAGVELYVWCSRPWQAMAEADACVDSCSSGTACWTLRTSGTLKRAQEMLFVHA